MSDIDRHTDWPETQHPLPVTVCPYCGYDLRYLVPPARCSECGEMIDDQMLQIQSVSSHARLPYISTLVVLVCCTLFFWYANFFGLNASGKLLFFGFDIVLITLVSTKLTRRHTPFVWITPTGIVSIDSCGDRTTTPWRRFNGPTFRPSLALHEIIAPTIKRAVEKRRKASQQAPDRTWRWILYIRPLSALSSTGQRWRVSVRCTWAEAEQIQERIDRWTPR